MILPLQTSLLLRRGWMTVRTQISWEIFQKDEQVAIALSKARPSLSKRVWTTLTHALQTAMHASLKGRITIFRIGSGIAYRYPHRRLCISQGYGTPCAHPFGQPPLIMPTLHASLMGLIPVLRIGCGIAYHDPQRLLCISEVLV